MFRFALLCASWAASVLSVCLFVCPSVRLHLSVSLSVFVYPKSSAHDPSTPCIYSVCRSGRINLVPRVLPQGRVALRAVWVLERAWPVWCLALALAP